MTEEFGVFTLTHQGKGEEIPPGFPDHASDAGRSGMTVPLCQRGKGRCGGCGGVSPRIYNLPHEWGIEGVDFKRARKPLWIPGRSPE